MTAPWLFVELFAGTASWTLWTLGCRVPPCGYMGSKRKLAPTLGALAGLRSGAAASAYVLVDAGPWGRTWSTLLGPRGGAVADLLREWARTRDPFELWYDLADAPEPKDDVKHAAAYLWLQARSASTTPVWWSSTSPELRAGTASSRTRADGERASQKPIDRKAPWSHGGRLRQASTSSRTAGGISGHTPWQTGKPTKAGGEAPLFAENAGGGGRFPVATS